MILVGLTGGIGSGKSVVSSQLATHGAIIVDADVIVRDLQRPGQPVFLAIVERFGAEVLGHLNLIAQAGVPATPTHDDALDEVNDSKFGLQAGIFTRDLFKAMRAWDKLEVGGVVIGDVPSYRVDNMPYGGVKDSGLGREGVRFAMEDMTEIRNLVIRTPG